MNIKHDIETVMDIEHLVNSFYQKLQINPVIGYIFMDMVHLDKKMYLRDMVNFWENALFYTGSYTGNPILFHKHLNKIFKLNAGHFIEWNTLFTTTVDELFSGEKATLAKQRAVGISSVVQLEIGY